MHNMNFDFSGFGNNTMKKGKAVDHEFFCIQNENLKCEFNFIIYQLTAQDGSVKDYLYINFKYDADKNLEAYLEILPGETLNVGAFVEENFDIRVLKNEKGEYDKKQLYKFVDRCLNRYANNENLDTELIQNNIQYTKNGLIFSIEDRSLVLSVVYGISNVSVLQQPHKPNMMINLQPMVQCDVGKIKELTTEEEKKQALANLLNECINYSQSKWIFLGKCVGVLVVVLCVGFLVIWKIAPSDE